MIGRMAELTERERAILDFEGRFFRRAGLKEVEIVEQFGVTPTAYYQELTALLRRGEAHAYAPIVAGRLRRRLESH